MLVATRWGPLIASYRQNTIPRWSRSSVRFGSNSTFQRGNDGFIHHSFSDHSEIGQELETLRTRQLKTRKAVDNLAQDLLVLSQYLSKAKTTRQLLLNHKTTLSQQTSHRELDTITKPLRKNLSAIQESLDDLDFKILSARQLSIPTSIFTIRLKRLHGTLPYPKTRLSSSLSTRISQSRQSNTTLGALLALPTAHVIDNVAHFLLTTSLPITEKSFLLMIAGFSRLRLASAARSAYQNMIAAGYAPTSPIAMALLLKLTYPIG